MVFCDLASFRLFSLFIIILSLDLSLVTAVLVLSHIVQAPSTVALPMIGFLRSLQNEKRTLLLFLTTTTTWVTMYYLTTWWISSIFLHVLSFH